jgi:hypothetical protein
LTSEERFKKIIEEFEIVSALFPKEVDLVEIEEAAREIGEEISRRVKIPKILEAVTRTIDRANEPVTHTFDIIKSDTRGRLREATVRSPSSNFSVLMLSDGVTRLSRSYSELANISQYLESIDAYQAEDGTYVLRIGEINWTSSFLLTIYVKEKIVFNNIFAVYDEYI